MRSRIRFFRNRYHYHQLTEEEFLFELLLPLITIIGIIVVSIIVEYGRVLLILLIASVTGFIVYVIAALWIKHIRYVKNKKSYLGTHYFQESQVPFTKEILNRELNFEITVYNSIREAIGKRYYLIHNYQIQMDKDLANVIKVDLLLFHSTGLYVIETMNLSLNKITKLKPKKTDEWKIGESTENISREMNEMTNVRQYERWIRSNIANNPIAQNQKKIDILKHIHDIEFENALVFSSEMLMGEENIIKNISSIFSENEFISHLKTKKTIYSDFQLSKIYQKFKN